MRAGPFIGAVILGLVIGAVATITFRSYGGGGGGGGQFMPRDRQNVIVLVRQGTDCHAIKADPVRGFQKDTIRWTVYDFCSLGQTPMEIRFAGDTPDDGSGKLQDSFGSNGQAKLHVRVKDLSGTPTNNGDGWKFTYHIWATVNGALSQVGDPDLEVDPWPLAR